MKISLNGKDALKYLLIAVFVSVTFCFAIKYLGLNGHIPWIMGYNDAGGWANKAFEPGMPYIDKLVEYPVIIGMTMYAASRFNLNYYLFFHYFLFLGCALATTYYLYKLSEELGTNKKYLFIFWAFAPSMLWFSYYNWDMITVMLSIMALYYYKEKKDILATVLLSLGFGTKIYPLLFFFPVLLHRKFFKWIKIGLVFLATFLIVNYYFMLMNFKAWYFIYGFHGMREPNIDSIWSVIMRFIPSLSIESVNWITLILFASLYLYINIKFRNRDFLFMSFISLLLFMIVNKVFSPQFIIWLLPFFAIYGIRLIPFYALEISNIAVLFATLNHIFSHLDFTMFLVYSGVFVVVRHVLLVHILIKELDVLSKG
ncbi:MAG: DUF2029 domain-containing protein [Nanoarchaeota archaeon]|nr:DUF2029 domain-containing protein [Nanoarchaeota archaeon]